MLLTIVSVTYVLVAVAMIVLILMQRGSGAAAGSGFGGGASATVFGARGSANFLSTATKWLAVVFMAMSLGMAWNATRRVEAPPVEDDLGVMSETPVVAPARPGEMPVIPSAPTDPAAPAPIVPAAGEVPDVEAAPVTDAAPAAAAPVVETETQSAEDTDQGRQED